MIFFSFKKIQRAISILWCIIFLLLSIHIIVTYNLSSTVCIQMFQKLGQYEGWNKILNIEHSSNIQAEFITLDRSVARWWSSFMWQDKVLIPAYNLNTFIILQIHLLINFKLTYNEYVIKNQFFNKYIKLETKIKFVWYV